MRRVLILLRHCESTGPAAESPLTEQGAADASLLAETLRSHGIDAVYASPYTRAIQSIEPFARLANLPITIDERLREHAMSPQPLEDWLEHTRRALSDIDHRVGDGDSLRETQTRALTALADIVGRDHSVPVVATHGLLLSSVLKHLRPEFAFDEWRAIGNPALFHVVFDSGKPQAFRHLSID